MIKPQASHPVAQLRIEFLDGGRSVSPPSKYPEEYPEIGQRVFVTKCAVCHEITSTYRQVGPGLYGTKDGKLPSGKDATDHTLLEILNEGLTGMPQFQDTLSKIEKEDVIAYIKTL